LTPPRAPPAQAATRQNGATLRDRWLLPARVAWVVTVLLILVLFVVGITG
jgi:hypothetical protein